MSCKNPPPGWSCSRDENHDGPCAASPIDLRRVLFGDEEAWEKYNNEHKGRRNECPRMAEPKKGAMRRLEDLERDVKNLQLNSEHYGQNAGHRSRYDFAPGTEWQMAPLKWVEHKQREERDAWDRGRMPPVGGRLDFRRYIYNRYGSWPPPKVRQIVTGFFGHLMYGGPLPHETASFFKSRWRWHDRIMFHLSELKFKRDSVACHHCHGGFYDAGSLGSRVSCEICDGEGRVPK